MRLAEFLVALPSVAVVIREAVQEAQLLALMAVAGHPFSVWKTLPLDLRQHLLAAQLVFQGQLLAEQA